MRRTCQLLKIIVRDFDSFPIYDKNRLQDVVENRKCINMFWWETDIWKLIIEIILSLGRCSEMENMSGYILDEVNYTQSILWESSCKIRFPYLEGQANERVCYFHLDMIQPITYFYKNGRIYLEILLVTVSDFAQKYHHFV